MSNLRNNVQLIGNLGKEIELKTTPTGKYVTSFSIATRDAYKNQAGETIEDTQWHNVVAWGKQAELLAKFLKKGSKVYVQGKLMHRSYDDANGVKRYITEVKLNNFELMTQSSAVAKVTS